MKKLCSISVWLITAVGMFSPGPLLSQPEWTSVLRDDSAYYGAISFISPDTGWVSYVSNREPLAEESGLLRTTNGGRTWDTVSINRTTRASPFNHGQLEFVDATTGWEWNNRGDLFHSTDGGRVWTNVTDNLPYNTDLGRHFYPNDYWITSADTAWGAGDRRPFDAGSPGVIRTTDGGATWDSSNIVWLTDDWHGFVDIWFLDEAYGWAMSKSAPRLCTRTTDGGETWSKDYLNDSADLERLFLSLVVFWNPDNGVAFPDDLEYSGAFTTTDGGLTWMEDPVWDTVLNHFGRIYDVEFRDGRYGWIVGTRSRLTECLRARSMLFMS